MRNPLSTLREKAQEAIDHVRFGRQQEKQSQESWAQQTDDDVEIEPGVFVPRYAYEQAITGMREEESSQEQEPQEQENFQEETPQETTDPYAKYGVVETSQHEYLQRWWIKFAAIIGAPTIWFVTSYSVAQWLTGFQAFSWGNAMWYVVAGVYEFMGIALLFVGAREIAKKNGGKAFLALSGSVFIALSTFFAQFLLLYSESARNLLSIPDAALLALPVSKSAILIFRAALPSVIELYLVFLVSEKKPDVHETIAQRRKIALEIAMLEEEETTSSQTRLARQGVNLMIESSNALLKQTMKQLQEGQQIIRTELRPKTFVTRVHDTQYLQEPEPLQAQFLTKPAQDVLQHTTPIDLKNALKNGSTHNGHSKTRGRDSGRLKSQDDEIPVLENKAPESRQKAPDYQLEDVQDFGVEIETPVRPVVVNKPIELPIVPIQTPEPPVTQKKRAINPADIWNIPREQDRDLSLDEVLDLIEPER